MNTIEINDDVLKEFDKYASLFGSTKEKLIEEALIEKLEELEDLRLAKQRLENPSGWISMEELEKELGLKN